MKEPYTNRSPANGEHAPELIARGESPFPLDLPPDAMLKLAKAVREIRRRQLMEWLAMEVARSISKDAARPEGR